MIDAITAMRGAVDSGKLKPLASRPRRATIEKHAACDLAEVIPGFEAIGWLHWSAPRHAGAGCKEDQRRPSHRIVAARAAEAL